VVENDVGGEDGFLPYEWAGLTIYIKVVYNWH
jgi:hypothetical protein